MLGFLRVIICVLFSQSFTAEIFLLEASDVQSTLPPSQASTYPDVTNDLSFAPAPAAGTYRSSSRLPYSTNQKPHTHNGLFLPINFTLNQFSNWVFCTTFFQYWTNLNTYYARLSLSPINYSLCLIYIPTIGLHLSDDSALKERKDADIDQFCRRLRKHWKDDLQ